jgi:hypothetical protein
MLLPKQFHKLIPVPNVAGQLVDESGGVLLAAEPGNNLPDTGTGSFPEFPGKNNDIFTQGHLKDTSVSLYSAFKT